MSQPHSQHSKPLKISHYDIIEPLGRGGMGVVYLAKDSRLERNVAIKCLHPDLFESHFIERFKREALLLAKLNHPYIVQIYDYVETPEQLALVMELVEGDHLKHHLKEHVVTLAQRLKWLVQISEGLAFAHEAGIIHRDLKPENILISKHLQAKISDLGIAKSYEINSTLTDHITGSYCAMSPEQASGLAVSFKSDLFSLGILAYQLLTGAHPFGNAGNKLQMMQRIITEPFTPLRQYNPDLAPDIIELIEQLLDKNPDNRPDNTHWVATQFERLRLMLANEPSQADDTLALMNGARAAASCTTVKHIEQKPQKKSVIAKIGQSVKNHPKYWFSGIAGLSAVVVTATLLTLPTDKTQSIGHNTESSTQNQIPPTEFSVAQNLKLGFNALKLSDLPGKLTTAENHFQAVLQNSPGNAAAVAGLSLVFSYRNIGDSEDPIWQQKALASAQQAMQLNTQLADTHTAMGYALSAKAKLDEALAAFERARQLDPTHFFALRGNISVLRHAKKFDKAIALANEALTHFPDERVFYDELGTIYTDAKDYPKAEQAFKRSIHIQPDTVYAYASLYIALERQNKDAEALKILQQGLQIRSSAWLHGNLGNALFIRGDFVGAAKAFKDAVSPDKGNPGSYLAWANLADTLRWIPGQESDAQNAYQKAQKLLAPILARQPDNPLTGSRMGLYLARLNQSNKAVKALDHALAISPKDASVHFRAGLAFEILNLHERAQNHIRQAVALGFPLKLIEAEPDLLNLRRQIGDLNAIKKQ